MTRRQLEPVLAEREPAIVGWGPEIEGCKHMAGAALFEETGNLYPLSPQTWIGRMD